MSVEQGEHSFAVEVLVSGDLIRGYTADGPIEAHKGVEITGNYEVSQVDVAGTGIRGVAAYDVADGEEIALVEGNDEARVIAGGAVTAGEPATTNADGDFVEAAAEDEIVGEFNESGGEGDVVEIRLTTLPGVEL